MKCLIHTECNVLHFYSLTSRLVMETKMHTKEYKYVLHIQDIIDI